MDCDGTLDWNERAARERRQGDTVNAAAAAANRLLERHGGCIEDAAAEARRYQLRYSPGTASWAHYKLVLRFITGGD